MAKPEPYTGHTSNEQTDQRGSTMSLKKVTMNLTESDFNNTAILVRRLHARNKASAVSSALAIAEELTRRIEDGDDLIVRRRNGKSETVIIPGIVQAQSDGR